MTAGHSHWHTWEQGQGDANTWIDGLAAGEPNSSCQCQERRLILGPQAVCGKGYSTVTAGSHHRYTRGMAACDRLRPAACRCAAGGAGPLCAHGCGVRCSNLGCVAPPTPLLQKSGLTASAGPALQGELEGGEDGDTQAAGICKDETDRKEACVMKSAGLGRGLSVVAVLAFGFLSCKAHWATLYRMPLGTTVTLATWLLLVATALFLFPTVCFTSASLGLWVGWVQRGSSRKCPQEAEEAGQVHSSAFPGKGHSSELGRSLSALTSISPEEGMM